MTEFVPTRVTCEQATALLLDYITGALDPVTTLALERHLERCADCVAFLQTYKETIRAARTLRYADMPGELQNRLVQTLHTKMKRARPQ
ncbi:MAG TPA: zf-HC2 domain-containing protein [Candidatus Tectomicrobia bacterium]